MSLFQQRIEGYLCHCLLAGYNISLCWHALGKKPSSQLGYWATALPCTLHFLPFSRLFLINVTLQCTDSFQSSLELFNCLWGFPSKLFFLWCKIENKSFCQIWRTLLLLLLLNFLSFFVTKRVRRVKKRSILWVSFVQSVVLFPFGSKLYWHLPTHQNTFCMSKAVWVSEEVRFSSRVFSHSLHTSRLEFTDQNNGYCGFQILVELLPSLAAAVRTCCVRQECSVKAVVLLP